MSTDSAPLTHGGELFCEEQDGIVEVIDVDNEVVVRLTLAAAEDLSQMLAYHAEKGRERARIS